MAQLPYVVRPSIRPPQKVVKGPGVSGSYIGEASAKTSVACCKASSTVSPLTEEGQANDGRRPEQKPVVVVESRTAMVIRLSKMTAVELRILASKRFINLKGCARKEQMIEAIIEQSPFTMSVEIPGVGITKTITSLAMSTTELKAKLFDKMFTLTSSNGSKVGKTGTLVSNGIERGDKLTISLPKPPFQISVVNLLGSSMLMMVNENTSMTELKESLITRTHEMLIGMEEGDQIGSKEEELWNDNRIGFTIEGKQLDMNKTMGHYGVERDDNVRMTFTTIGAGKTAKKQVLKSEKIALVRLRISQTALGMQTQIAKYDIAKKIAEDLDNFMKDVEAGGEDSEHIISMIENIENPDVLHEILEAINYTGGATDYKLTKVAHLMFKDSTDAVDKVMTDLTSVLESVQHVFTWAFTKEFYNEEKQQWDMKKFKQAITDHVKFLEKTEAKKAMRD